MSWSIKQCPTLENCPEHNLHCSGGLGFPFQGPCNKIMATISPSNSPARDTARTRAAQEIAAPNTSPTPAPRERSHAISSSAGEKFSDMTIVCGDRQFKTHRAIVCTQSPFFDKAMNGYYKESRSRSIELPEDDPDVVERFLEFLYTGNYSDGVNFTGGKPSEAALLDSETVIQNLQEPTCGSKEVDIEDWISDSEPDEEYNEYGARMDSPSDNGDGEKSKLTEVAEAVGDGSCSREEGLKQLAELRNDMTLHLRLYVMADKDDVPALRLLARDRFYRAVELVWEEAECFPDVVDELYQTTPPADTAMREIVCRLVGASIHLPSVREKMRSVMMKHGDFAFGVMEYSIHLHTLFASDE